MSSQRITAHIRDALICAACDRKFSKEREALQKRRDDLETFKIKSGVKAYKALWDAATYKKLRAVPKGWLPTTLRVRVNVAGEGVREVPFYQPMPIPEKMMGYSVVVATFEPDAEVLTYAAEAKAIQNEISADAQDLRQRERELSAKVRGVIESVTTTNRLKEIWPECAELLPPEAQPAGVFLPAINLADLNKELGLG